MEKVLQLPVDLRERRSLLESELSKTIQEIIATELKEKLQKIVGDVQLEDTPTSINWEFHPESDDEGGTDWWIYYVQLHGENGLIDTEEITVKVEKSYGTYEYSLAEELSETLSEYRDDLHHHGIEEILL